MAAKPKVLAVFYPGCIEFEIMLAIELLREGFAIETCSSEGGLHHSQSGLQYQTNYSFEQVNPTDYRAILIPGGDPYELLESRAIDRLLQSAVETGATLAAICAGDGTEPSRAKIPHMPLNRRPRSLSQH